MRRSTAGSPIRARSCKIIRPRAAVAPAAAQHYHTRPPRASVAPRAVFGHNRMGEATMDEPREPVRPVEPPEADIGDPVAVRGYLVAAFAIVIGMILWAFAM